MAVRALLLDQNLRLFVGERELSDPAPDEVLIEVAFAGVCGSDLHVLATGDWVTYWPATLGHEVAGRISVSSDPGWPPGTAVVLDSRMPTRVDGRWVPGDRLDPNLTWLGEVLPGGYAAGTVVPTASLHAVPDGLPLETAVLAEPLAVVLCAIDQLGPLEPATVLIYGYGPIGFLLHSELRRRFPGAEVTVAESNPDRAGRASRRGATVVSKPATEGYDVVVDAAGFLGSLAASLSTVRRGGRVLLVALPHEPATIEQADVVDKSVTVTGTNGFDTHHLGDALRLLAADPGLVDGVVDPMVDLGDAPRFLASPERAAAMKILLNCAAG